MAAEGDIKTHKITGEKIIFTGNQWRAIPESAGGTFVRSAATQAIDNLSNIPSALGNFAIQEFDRFTNPVQEAVNLGASALGMNKPFNTEMYAGNTGQGLIDMPKINLRVDPKADEPAANLPQIPMANLGDEAIAAAAMVNDRIPFAPSGNIPQSFQETVARQAYTRERQAEQNPLSALAGQITGDAASLVAARSPIARHRGQAAIIQRANINRAINQKAQAGFAGAEDIAGAVTNPANRNLRRAITDSLKNFGAARYGATRGKRVIEAGAEGYLLGLMNDQDPMELAAFGAGLQGAGSIALSLLTLPLGPTFKSAGLRVVGGAVAFAGITQLLDMFGIGENRSFLQDVQGGFEKIALTMAAAVPFALMGTGRITKPEKISAAIPGIMDSISSFQRGAAMSAFGEYFDDSQTKEVMDKYMTDPYYFGPTAARQIDRALRNESVSLTTTIERLRQNQNFIDKLEAL
jgi:hypothetical protein|tara:strand:+ start:6389 stop:7783 length:1395 start_codon:yes stop_codon:yes gene_type:complete